jgi:hypothetical protein
MDEVPFGLGEIHGDDEIAGDSGTSSPIAPPLLAQGTLKIN